MSKDRHISKDHALDISDDFRSAPSSRRPEPPWSAPDGRRDSHDRARMRALKSRGRSDKDAQRQIRDFLLAP